MAEALAAVQAKAQGRDAQEAARTEAARLADAEEAQLAEEADSIRRAFKRGGLQEALKIGRTYKWDRDQVEELFRAPEPDDQDYGEDMPPPPPEEGGAGDKTPYKLKPRPIKPLPEDCPVTPLGIDGEVCFYLSPTRQFLPLESHSAEAIRKLFAARIEWLWAFLPKFSAQTFAQTSWDAARTADSLIQSCGLRGPFDPAERLRGVGAWRADDGRLILHLGDRIIIGGEPHKPGFLGEHVYPGAAPLPPPADSVPMPEEIDAFLTLLDGWNWTGEFESAADEYREGVRDPRRHRLSSLLLLGWIASARVGGALDWRPMVWLTGDAGSGKSTLQQLIEAIQGKAMVSSSDATAAGIYQSIGYSSRAAGIDEAEADPFSPKMKSMVELVRQSSSGGQILRGSNDPRKWRGFTARSSFLLSSIVIPPLMTQDVQRITILPLGPLPAGAALPRLDRPKYAAFGQRLLARLVANWPRWEETLQAYRTELGRLGHSNRSADQIGGLLAMSDMARFGPDGADRDTIIEMCAAFDERNKMRDDTTSEQFLNWLLSISLDVFRGGTRRTVGTLVAGAAALIEVEGGTAASCAGALEAHGVFVEGFKNDAIVTLPNQSAGLAKLLEGSPWGTRAGAANPGWRQAMERLATARRPDGTAIGGKTNSRKHGGRGWSLPVGVFLRTEE